MKNVSKQLHTQHFIIYIALSLNLYLHMREPPTLKSTQELTCSGGGNPLNLTSRLDLARQVA